MSFIRTCFIVALVGIAWSCVLGLQRPPPRYSQQYMPETGFTCRNKIVGSYYADPETDCQLFHVCVSVAGSVQDYKFLCPNDTAFDQESQTCADWYDVDCEAATLYYASDNFDLYRLGSGLESLHYDSVRSDAEPQDNLQRSETSDPVRSAVNNLNRVTPSNANNNAAVAAANSRDILRPSSSINFYNSRNGGKDEDYDSSEQKSYEPVQEPKKTSGVRKVARKQHTNNNNNVNNINLSNSYAASSTIAPPVIANTPNTNKNSDNFYYNSNNNNNNVNYNRQRTTFAPSSTTITPVSQQATNYNVRNQNNHRYNNPTSTYRPTTAQQTYSTYNAPSTTARTTGFNNYNNNNNAYNSNNNQQQTSNSYGQNIATSPKPTSYSQNYPSGVTVTSTPRSTSYSENYPDEQNFKTQYNQFAGQNGRAQSTPSAQSSTNFDYTKSSDYTNFQRNYNNIQRSTSPAANAAVTASTAAATTAASTFFDNYNGNSAAAGAQYNKASGQPSTRQATQQTTKFYPPNYQGSSYIPTTYSPPTKKTVIGENNSPIQSNSRNVERFNSPQANGQDNGQYNNNNNNQQQQSTSRGPKRQNAQAQIGNGRGIDRYNSQATGNDNGQYVNQQNPQQQVRSSQYYESTRAPKKATQYNNNYDITNNGKYYESSTGSYDNGRSQTGIGFSPSSINLLAETPRSTTPAAPKRSNGPTTYNPNSYNANNNNERQTSATTPRAGTTFVSGSARPFSTTSARFNDPTTTPKPKSPKKNDYDYAYYDNAGGLEYDGLDLEHVVAGNKESSKISRN